MVKLGILASDLRAHDGPSSSSCGAREGDVDENSKPARTAKRRRARATATEATTAVRRSSRRRVETSPVVDVDVEEEEEARDDAAHETAAREYASRHAGKQASGQRGDEFVSTRSCACGRWMITLKRRVETIERARGNTA